MEQSHENFIMQLETPFCNYLRNTNFAGFGIRKKMIQILIFRKNKNWKNYIRESRFGKMVAGTVLST